MQQNLNIRQATFIELDLLAKYDSQVNQTPWSKQQYQSSFTNKHKILVLELSLSKEIIAAIVFNQLEDSSDILQIWVRQEYLRSGYGKTILNFVITQLKQDGVVNIFLEVGENNLPAIALYNKVGFKHLNIRKNYYKIGSHLVNAIVMKLELPSTISLPQEPV